MKMPPAEIDVSDDLARQLIRSQHPDLDGPLLRTANGWDNVIFRLGEDLAVRLPRRALAAELIKNEQRWLPEIGGGLPLAVPIPVRIGRPSSVYPWPWSITRWFDGSPLAQLTPRDRRPYARDLGHFLARLHTPAPPEAPQNPVRGIPLIQRSELLDRHLDQIRLDGETRLRDLWAHLSSTPAWSGPRLWLHGDPHPGNVLVEGGRLSAVIDFGDLTAGDPATDLAMGWLAFDTAGRADFVDAYAHERPLDEATWTRARGWGLCLAVALLANTDDEPVLARVGQHTMNEVLASR